MTVPFQSRPLRGRLCRSALLLLFISAGAFACDGGPHSPVNNEVPVGGAGPATSGGRGTPSGEQATRGVIGRVTAPDGSPVVGAWVQAKSLDNPSKPIPELMIVSDDDGKYEWALRPGTYEITVSVDGYKSAAKTTSVSEGAATTLDFQLEPAS